MCSILSAPLFNFLCLKSEYCCPTRLLAPPGPQQLLYWLLAIYNHQIRVFYEFLRVFNYLCIYMYTYIWKPNLKTWRHFSSSDNQAIKPFDNVIQSFVYTMFVLCWLHAVNQLIYSFSEYHMQTIPMSRQLISWLCIVRMYVTTALDVLCRQIIVFHGIWYHLSASPQCWGMLEYQNTFTRFLK